MEHLARDIRREANAPHRGYRFQDLYAARLWCSLGPSQHLVLEGAEDVDLIDTDQKKATVHQVRDVPSRAVTLRTRGVHSFIEHLRRHEERNPDVEVYGVYATTAEVGLEKGCPFGPEAGIMRWRSSSGSVVDGMAEMLVEVGLDERTGDWLRRDGGRFHRVRWETGLDKNVLREGLESDLSRVAARIGLSPASAADVLPAVLDAVGDRTDVDEITERRLDRVGLLRLLETHTTVRVDRRTLGVLRSLAASAAQRDAEDLDGSAGMIAAALVGVLGGEFEGPSSEDVYLGLGEVVAAYRELTEPALQHHEEAFEGPPATLPLAGRDRRILGLLVASPFPFRRADLVRLESGVPWEAAVRSLLRRGIVSEDDGGHLTVVDGAARTMEKDEEEMMAAHATWVDVLTPKGDHPDLALLLGIHLLHLGEVDASADVIAEAAMGLDPGYWNGVFLVVLDPLLDRIRGKPLAPERRAALLNAHGLVLSRERRLDEAGRAFVRLRAHAKRHDLTWYVGQSYINAGVTRFESGDTAGAERMYSRAVRHAEETGDSVLLGRSLHNLGMTVADRDLEEAEQLLSRGLAVKERADDPVGVVGAHLGLGYVFAQRKEFDKAKAAYRSAERLARRLDLSYERSLALSNLGSVEVDLGRPEAGAQLYQEARSIAEAEGYAYTERLTTEGLGRAATDLGDHEGSIPHFERLYELQRERGDVRGAVIARHDVGLSLAFVGREAEARRHIGRALAMARRAGLMEWVYRCRLAGALSHGGGVGTLDTVPYLRRVARDEARRGEERVAARLHYDRARVLMREGEWEAAGLALDDAEETVPGSGSEDVEVAVHTLRYGLLVDGPNGRALDPEAVLDTLDRMISAAERGEMLAERRTAMDQKAVHLQEEGRLDEALALHHEALAIAESLGDVQGAATSAVNLAEGLRKSGRSAEAMALYDRALRGFEEAGDADGVALATINRGLGLQQVGDVEGAEQAFRAVRDRARRQGRSYDESRAVRSLGNLAWAEGRRGLALRRYQRAYEVADGAGLDDEAYEAGVSYTYALRDMGRSAEAQEVAVRIADGVNPRDPRSGDAAWAAAEASEAAGDWGTAARWWSRVVEVADDAETVAAARAAVAKALHLAGDVDGGAGVFAEALGQETTASERARMMADRAGLLYRQGDVEGAERWIERAEAETDDPEAHVDVAVCRAQGLWAAGEREASVQAYVAAMVGALGAGYAPDLTEPDLFEAEEGGTSDDEDIPPLRAVIAVGMDLWELAYRMRGRTRKRDVRRLLRAAEAWIRGPEVPTDDPEALIRLTLWPLRLALRLPPRGTPQAHANSRRYLDVVYVELQRALGLDDSDTKRPPANGR